MHVDICANVCADIRVGCHSMADMFAGMCVELCADILECVTCADVSVGDHWMAVGKMPPMFSARKATQDDNWEHSLQ